MQIIYNGQTIPNTYSKFHFSIGYTKANLSCVFFVQEATAAALVASCNTIESKLKEKNADLTLSFGGTAEYSYSHASNTGFLAKPQLTKVQSEICTETSRGYSFAVEIQLPFDQTGYNYRQDASFSVAYAGSRKRTVTFNVTYTAGGTNTALQNYTAYAKTWMASILLSLGGTYELVSENINPEEQIKKLSATVVYREILANETETSLDDIDIVNANCSYSVQYGQEIGQYFESGESFARPPVTVNLSYSAEINKETVLLDKDIEATYRTKIRPWLLKHTYSVLGLANRIHAGGNFIMQSERYTINPYNYNVSGNLSFLAPASLGQIIDLMETRSTSTDNHITTQKLWDGKDHTYNMYSTGKQTYMDRTITISKLGSDTIDISPVEYPDDEGIWILLNRSQRKYKKKYGTGGTGPHLSEVTVHFQSVNERYIYVIPIKDSDLGPKK